MDPSLHYLHETNAIRHRMEEVRCELDQDVQGIVERARDLRDWRSYVRSYPWVCVGAAVAVGYLLVPRRPAAMQPNAETLAELVEAEPFAKTPRRDTARQGARPAVEECGQSGDAGSVSVCRATSRQTFWATGRQFTTGRSTMKNRIPAYPSDSRRTHQPSESAFQELRDLAHKQFADRMRQAETYVRKHPVSGLGAALCIGIIVGWVIKRK